MRKPRIPSDYWNTYDKHKDSFIKIVTEINSCLYKGQYIHWDDFLNRKLESDLTHEQYWYGLKYLRNAARVNTPLSDKYNKPFGYVLTDEIFKTLHRIDINTAGKIESLFPSALNNENKERYVISSLIEEAITSSQIEGAVTTRKVAKEMIRSGRAPKDVSEKMILNNYLTMKKITEIKNEKLTPELILEIHRQVTMESLDDPSGSGRLRASDEKIEVGDEISGETYHIPPNAEELEYRLERLCKFANNESGGVFIHPVIRAIVLHFSLAYDHPFIDGNGRTARAVFYWSMLNSGYWLFEYISISQAIKNSKVKYYRSFLLSETDDNDLTYFILYHLEIINASINNLGRYLEKKTKEERRLEKEVRSLSMFNHRQKALLSHALKNPHQTYTYKSHASSHNIARQTARTDILGLEKLGLLVQGGPDKKRNFQPANNLQEKLLELSD
jgi:Fic family protein